MQRQQDEQASSFKGSPVVGYIRSARRGDPQLDEWEAQIRAYCAERGYNLVEVVRDEAVSAVTTWKPGLDRILHGIARKQWVGVLAIDCTHLGSPRTVRRRMIKAIEAANGWLYFIHP